MFLKCVTLCMYVCISSFLFILYIMIRYSCHVHVFLCFCHIIFDVPMCKEIIIWRSFDNIYFIDELYYRTKFVLYIDKEIRSRLTSVMHIFKYIDS